MNANRSLLRHGAFVLVLSLLAGLLIAAPGVANPRMAVSAHLAGLISGPILLALGLAWPHLHLSPRVVRATELLLVVSIYANFAFVVLAAVFGTSEATPIAGAGHGGAPWQETLVTAGFGVTVVALFVAFCLVALGFARRDAQGLR